MSSNVEDCSENIVEGKGAENGLEIIEEDKAALAKSETPEPDRNPMLSEYEDLRREMTALRSEHEKAVADKRDVFLQLQKVQLQVNEWETNYNTLKENNERLKRENSAMKTQVTVGGKAEYADSDREQLINEIDSLNAKIASMKEAYEYLQLEKSTLEEKVSILQKTISSLENTNESLLMEKDRLQQGLDSSLRREREGSVRSAYEYSTVHHSYLSSGEYDSLKLKYDELSREKYSLEYQLRVAKEKISELESRPRTESTTFDQGHHSIVSHSVVSHGNYSKLEEDYKQLLHDKIKLASEMEMKHRRELEEKQTSIFKLEQELRESRTGKVRYEELYKENEFLIKEKLNLENELRATKEKVFIAESSKVNETRLERELVAYNDKYATLEKEYSALMQEKRKFEADLYIQVRKEGEEKQTQIYKLEREIMELRADKARYDDVCREKEFLIKERASMENELRVAREKAVEYESRSMMESRTEQELAIFRDRYAQLEKEYSEAMQGRRRHEADLHIQVRREVEEKQAHIYKLESEMHELRMNADRYEDVLKEKEYLIKERFNLENELRTTRQRIVEFESRSAMEGRFESELVGLKERYAKLESDYSASLQEKRRLEADFHIQVRKEMEEKQSHIYQLEAEMQGYRMDKARYEDLLKEKEYLVKEKLDMERELRTAREKIMEFESRAMLESRTEKELVIYQDKFTQLEKEYSNMMQERRRHEADLHIQVRKEVEEKQAHIFKIERELHELQLEKSKYDDLYREKEFLLKERYNMENEFRLAREKITELESQSMMEARTEKELGILQERYTKLEKDYSLLMQERRRAETEVHIQARKEVEEKQNHIYKLEVELRELRMDKGRFDDLTREKEFLVKEKFDLESELRTMREKIMEYETRLMMEGRIEKEFTLFKEKYAQLERDYSVLIQEKRRMETEGQLVVRKEVEEKQSHIYKLEVELRELRMDKGRFDDLTREKEFLVKEKFDLESELRTMREKIMEYETRLMMEGRIEKEFTLFKEKYSQLERDYSVLIQEKRRIETEGQLVVRKEVEEKQSHIYKLEVELRELRMDKGRFDDLTREKEFLVKEKFDLESELRTMKEKIMEYETRSMMEGRIEKEFTMFKEKYAQLERDYSVLIQEKRRMETEGQLMVRKEVEEKQSHIYRLEQEMREMSIEKGRYDDLYKEKEFLLKERYNLENELRIAREKIVEFESRSMVEARTEKELILFHEKYGKLEKDYSLLLQEKRKIESDVEIRVRREGEERQGLIYKLESEIHALRGEKERYDDVVREKEFLIKERYNLETELRETREKMLEFETRLKTDGARSDQEMAVFRNKYANLEEGYNFLEQEKKRLEEDIEIRVKKEFWEKQESVYKLEKEIRELKSENEYYQTTVEEKNASISELRVSVNNLQRQVETLKKELFVAEEAYEKAEIKLKDVLKSEYKPVTTYVVRRTVRTSSSSSQKNDADNANTVIADDAPVITKDFEATSTPKVVRKSEVKVVETSPVSGVTKTIDFNESVAEEKSAKSEVEKSASKEDLSESAYSSSSSYYRPTYTSYTSPRSSSVRAGSSSRYGNKYTSGTGYSGSSYSAGGSSYRARQPSTSRYSVSKKYY